MNSYKGEWLDDYVRLSWVARELMKQDAYNKMTDSRISLDEKVECAEQVIKSHFLRSAQVFVLNDKRRTHPSFTEYAAMMLNQETYLDQYDDDVKEALIRKYGQMDGIPYGSYYQPK